jgi:hypothetical protein
VGEYFHQMKGMADSLRDLGKPIADRTLVLDILRGLSPRYGRLKALIKRIVPFPAFYDVRNELLLEELTLETEAPAPAPPLYSARRGGQAPSGGGGQVPRPPSTGATTCTPPAAPATPRPASNTDGGRHSRKGSNGNGGSTQDGPSGRGGGQAWPSFYKLWTGTIALWSGQAPSASCPPTPALLTAPPHGVPPTTPTSPQLPPLGTPTPPLPIPPISTRPSLETVPLPLCWSPQ